MRIVLSVRSLDVWGHCQSECEEYDCPCMKEGAHDEGRCNCGFDVNDSFANGFFGVEVEGTTYNVGTPHAFTSYAPSDAQLFEAMQRDNYFRATVCQEDVDFESPDGEVWEVNDADTGEPLYTLHVQEEGHNA